ncbi:hypothetical protein COOONC_19308 [Cooperia oncophora]
MQIHAHSVLTVWTTHGFQIKAISLRALLCRLCNPIEIYKKIKKIGLFSVISLSIRPVKSVSASVRSAIMTMVAIVASYLISNTLHLILTVMERSDHPILHDTEDPLQASTFHTFFSDMVSFVYMFTSAIRLLIYFFCNPAIRGDILNFFGSPTPVLL